MIFVPPEPEECRRAIGSLNDLPLKQQRVFEPNGDFSPIPVPGPGDWLSTHLETGQSFDLFTRENTNLPDEERHTLYLQPLDHFPEHRSPPLIKLKKFAECFFSLPVKLLPAQEIQTPGVASRRNPYTGMMQFLTSDILNQLRKKLPDDAFCVLGITMRDLYPRPSWNFVFGQASLRHRVGIYSFARYDPVFTDEKDEDSEKTLLRRSCKVLAHEILHMFGLKHCIYFHCLLNGSNHLGESDARPLYLCPVDLRKIHHSIGFDPLKRYRSLRRFYRSVQFDDEVSWIERRIAHITTG